MRLTMKLIELGIDINNQLKTPQSPGSRGVALSKSKPPKRYLIQKNKQKYSTSLKVA